MSPLTLDEVGNIRDFTEENAKEQEYNIRRMRESANKRNETTKRISAEGTLLSEETEKWNPRESRETNRGEVLHASFHFESRSSTALNAERVAPIRPNGTFADARTENKRRNTKRYEKEDEEEEKTHERQVLPYKTVIDKGVPWQCQERHPRRHRATVQLVALRQPITSCCVTRPAPRPMMHA